VETLSASVLTPATPADVPALVALINQAYRSKAAHQAWTTEDHLLEGPRIDEAGLHEMLRAPKATLLKYLDANGNLIGCVYLQRQGCHLYLGTLAVAPSAQGQGVGKQLLAQADDYARQQSCSHLKITVLSARPELVAWYERHGYVQTGEAEPFPETLRFGKPRQLLTLLVLEKAL
jgi:ribosomal protein S18 acetylase RimI-like enzyme